MEWNGSMQLSAAYKQTIMLLNLFVVIYNVCRKRAIKKDLTIFENYKYNIIGDSFLFSVKIVVSRRQQTNTNGKACFLGLWHMMLYLLQSYELTKLIEASNNNSFHMLTSMFYIIT